MAARTAAAATEIQNVIERANREVSAGVREIETVKTKIADIDQGFRNVSGQMRDVTQNNLRQSAAIGLISQGLEQLSALTQANTELVVESVGASEQTARHRAPARRVHAKTQRGRRRRDGRVCIKWRFRRPVGCVDTGRN